MPICAPSCRISSRSRRRKACPMCLGRWLQARSQCLSSTKPTATSARSANPRYSKRSIAPPDPVLRRQFMTFDIGDGVDSAVNYILDNFAPLLDLIAAAIGTVTNSIQAALLAAPLALGLAIFVLLSLWRVGFGFAVFTALSLMLVEHMGLWSAMMETLSLVIASTLV